MPHLWSLVIARPQLGLFSTVDAAASLKLASLVFLGCFCMSGREGKHVVSAFLEVGNVDIHQKTSIPPNPMLPSINRSLVTSTAHAGFSTRLTAQLTDIALSTSDTSDPLDNFTPLSSGVVRSRLTSGNIVNPMLPRPTLSARGLALLANGHTLTHIGLEGWSDISEDKVKALLACFGTWSQETVTQGYVQISIAKRQGSRVSRCIPWVYTLDHLQTPLFGYSLQHGRQPRIRLKGFWEGVLSQALAEFMAKTLDDTIRNRHRRCSIDYKILSGGLTTHLHV